MTDKIKSAKDSLDTAVIRDSTETALISYGAAGGFVRQLATDNEALCAEVDRLRAEIERLRRELENSRRVIRELNPPPKDASDPRW